MKRLVAFVSVAFLSAVSIPLCFAGSSEIAQLMQLGIAPEKAAKIDALYSTAITSTSVAPNTTNVTSLGSVSKFFKHANITNLAVGYETVAAAGSTTSDAGALSATKMVHQVTGADGVKGVKLGAVTAATVGDVHILLNTTAAVIKVYAETGGTVNGGSVDAAFSALTGVKPVICISTALLTWICA